MAARPLSSFRHVQNRPGLRTRELIGSEHGVVSFFVDELLMDQGASIPLHTHPVEEAFLVAEGAITVRIGDRTVTAEAEAVVRIPPGVPHALRNSGQRMARALAAAPWDRVTFFRRATSYLEGQPPE
jgi:quercetin dioxygenase-like cupin family protein